MTYKCAHVLAILGNSPNNLGGAYRYLLMLNRLACGRVSDRGCCTCSLRRLYFCPRGFGAASS